MTLPSLYIHVPLCKSRCNYCDFHSNNMSSVEENFSKLWADSVIKHFLHLEDKFSKGIYSIFFGGGSPSALPLDVLEKVIKTIEKNTINSIKEWTIEANPEDITDDFISLLNNSPVNRLSLGIQSFNDTVRHNIQRRGSAASAKKVIEKLITKWKGRLSCDLIYGLPYQDSTSLCNDIDYLLKIGLEHLSLYELTLEENTTLYKMVANNKISIPNEDEKFEMYEKAKSILQKKLQRYEVSNWASLGSQCLHNNVYWRLGTWHGLGPSAVSNIPLESGENIRISNTVIDKDYFSNPLTSSKTEIINIKDSSFEYLMTSMRTFEGFDVEHYSKRFGLDPNCVFGNIKAKFPDYIEMNSKKWYANDKGLDMLDRILVFALKNSDNYFGDKK